MISLNFFTFEEMNKHAQTALQQKQTLYDIYLLKASRTVPKA